MKRRVVLGILSTCSLAWIASADPVPTPECKAWIESVQAYSLAMHDAVGGAEIEDAVGVLERSARVFLPDATTLELDALRAQCERFVGAMAEITPPVELQTLHQRICAYYGVVAISAARILEGGLEAKPYALRDALTELIGVFDRMLEDFAENGCETGDTESIRERILPELRQRLGVLEREIDGP